jgi:hypothetical protein
MDATGAENHCTILAIAPSPVEKGLIWIGTDDGKVQLTRDGGKTWTDVTSKIAGMPKGAWIPQVKASAYKAGEVFVVVNNYRLFDYKPYLFRSRDYGQTWESMVSASQLGDNNFTLAIVQDVVEPKLIFVGAENGLFVSLDDGKTYTRWTNEFPAGVPTMDLVIHPREHDLVIGTFGRAIYVLDDIRPLRQIAKEGLQILTKPLHVFSPPDAYQVTFQDPAGVLFPGNAMFQGENKRSGAMISYVLNKPEEKKEAVPVPAKSDSKKGDKKSEVKPVEVKKEEKPGSKVKYDSITLEVFNSKGEKIRTVKQKAPEDNGISRMFWSMNEKGSARPSREKPRANAQEPGGSQVLPGTYKLRLTFGDKKIQPLSMVKSDPRFNTPESTITARYTMIKDLQTLTGTAAQAMNQLRESKEIADEYEKKMKGEKRDDLKDAMDKTKVVKDSIAAIMDYIVGKDDKRQGIVRQPDPTPVSYIFIAQRYIATSKDPVSATDQRVYKQAQDAMAELVKRVNKFYEQTWPEYRVVMEKVSISPFKNYDPLKLD